MTRVLVVEDEESFSDALTFMLKREGYEVAVAADGNAAIEEFEKSGADILLLDLMLPGLPGTEVCRQIRTRSQVPIIMLTAKDGEVDKVVGLELGADDYVTKPFSPRELVARIKAVLRRTGAPEAGQLAFGPLVLDTQSHRLSVGEDNIHIGPTEFRLLEFLMRHPERAFDREQLLDRVWGRAVYVEERTVDVHILRLRKVLKPFGVADWVQTVRGVGYRFSPPADSTGSR